MELHLSDLAAIQLHSCTCKQHRRNSNILQCCSLDLCENSRTRGRHHPMAARSHPRGCAEVTVSRARHRQHAHESGHAGGLDPGPSTREMAAIPLHHVPMEYLRKWAHTPQSISVLVVEYRVPSLLLLCFWCVSCVCVLSWLSSWLGGGLGAMSRRREIHGAATITARRPATLRAQALPGRLEPS